MKKITIEDRQQWWLLCYGITSMTKVIKTCDIIAHCDEPNSPFVEPLSVAIHTYYARPFMACRFTKKGRSGNKLKSDIVPPDGQLIHEFLMDMRATAIGHIDGRNHKPAGRPMNDVMYSITSEGTKRTTLRPSIPIEKYAEVRAHALTMIEVFRGHIEDFEKMFASFLPSREGDYILVPVGDGPIFVKDKERPASSVIEYRSNQ